MAVYYPRDIVYDPAGYPEGDHTPLFVRLNEIINETPDDDIVINFDQDYFVSYIRGETRDRYLGQYPNRSGVNFDRPHIRLTSPNNSGLVLLPTISEIPLTFKNNPVPGYCYTGLSIGERRLTPTMNEMPLLKGVTVEGIRIDGSLLDDDTYMNIARASISGGLALTRCENAVVENVTIHHITGFTGGLTTHLAVGFTIIRDNRVVGRLVRFVNPVTGAVGYIKFGNLYWNDGTQDSIFNGNSGELGANAASFATNHDLKDAQGRGRRSQDCNISNNTFTNCNAGITLHGVGHTVRENHLTDCAWGFVVENSGVDYYVARYNRIVANTVERTTAMPVGGMGIELRGSGMNWTETNYVEDNTFRRMRDGIILQPNTKLNIVRGNKLEYCKNPIVFNGDTALTNTVVDNIITSQSMVAQARQYAAQAVETPRRVILTVTSLVKRALGRAA